MKKIAPHLSQVRTQISNIWLLEDLSGRKFLIDTGHRLERLSLVSQLWFRGIRHPGDLTAILLTHRHSDHAGNAAFLGKRFGAPIICHAKDAEILMGRANPPSLLRDSKSPKRKGVRPFYERWLCAFEDRAPSACEVDDAFKEGDWQWGFRVVPVLGHTEGSVMLLHEPSATLFSGDAILVGDALSHVIGSRLRHPSKAMELRLAEPGFSLDAESCHRAVQDFLRQLPLIATLCPGHGVALNGDIQARLQNLTPRKKTGTSLG